MVDNNGVWISFWYFNGGVGEGLMWVNNIYGVIVNGNVLVYLYWVGV